MSFFSVKFKTFYSFSEILLKNLTQSAINKKGDIFVMKRSEEIFYIEYRIGQKYDFNDGEL